MDRKKALTVYLTGTLLQIIFISIVVFVLRSIGIKTDYNTIPGLVAIAVGGLSSAIWGSVVTKQYISISYMNTIHAFFNVKQPISYYGMVMLLLVILFFDVAFIGGFSVGSWYLPITLFLKSIIFGGLEEVGWRYTFQPILEEKAGFITATLATFVFWSVWHFLYFYIEGTLIGVNVVPFLAGLLTNCFMLAAIYRKTNSLWLCVMTHALINMLSQISMGENTQVAYFCKIVIVVISCALVKSNSKEKGEKEK